MTTIGPYSLEQYSTIVKDFHGTFAPWLLAGGFMVDLARKNLPPVDLFDVISETISCLPDAIQLLTPCTIGNGWLRVIDTGRFALTLFEKYGGSGVRVSINTETLEAWPEIKAWFLKLVPKEKQDKPRLLNVLDEARTEIYRVERVQVKREYLKKQKKTHIRLCPRCGEPFRSDAETACLFCTKKQEYYGKMECPE